MRIAMLGHKRVPSREGGIEIVVEELAVRMAARGHEVTVYNRSGHHVSGREFNGEKLKSYKGVRIKTVPAVNFKGIAAMTASFFASVCAAFGHYDVVHFHAEGPCATLWLPKLFGKRCVVTVHGLDHQRSKWGRIAKAYIMLGEKCAVRYADEIIVLSRSVQEYFKEKYGRDTVLIPNGVTPVVPRVADQIIQRFGIEKDSYVLYLGRITPEKGIHYLIQAYKGLKTDKKLVIAGGASDSDDYYAELKAMAEGDSNIIFTGFVQGQLLEELYSNAYVYVQPSDLEGMSLSLLEAMSYGNCCVVSDIPECKDVVGDVGIIFPRGQIKRLESCLQQLSDNPQSVEQCQKKVSSFICGKFSWNEVVDKTIKYY